MYHSKIILVFYIVILFAGCKKTVSPPPFFVKIVDAEVGDRIITPWVSEDGLCYLFIPSFSSLRDVFLVPNGKDLSINGKPFIDVICLEDIKDVNSDSLFFCASEYENLMIKLLFSSKIPSIFINTSSGTLDYIHSDKNNIEEVAFLVYNCDGSVDYVSEDCTLKGRGHGTWGGDKKPYLLRLPEKASILGMNKSRKWVLLANSSDVTNLRNWLSLTLAQKTRLQHTPELRFADLYINGEYKGLYNIAEKVDEKLVAAGISKPVLMKIDTDSEGDMFVTDKGTKVQIENAGDGFYSVESVRDSVNKFEHNLLDNRSLANIDVDTWASKYLVDEVTENGDAGARSNYFYFFEDSLLLYGGPVWDYDLSFARNRYVSGNPRTFTAKREWRTPAEWTPYFSYMLADSLFYKRVVEIFAADLAPEIEYMINCGIATQSNEIDRSSRMNKIRWNIMYTSKVYPTNKPTVNNAIELCSFLAERYDFLKSAWIDNKKYWLVQVGYYENGQYMCFSVGDGEVFDFSDLLRDPDFKGFSWVDEESGERYSERIIVTKDMRYRLTPQVERRLLVKRIKNKIEREWNKLF